MKLVDLCEIYVSALEEIKHPKPGYKAEKPKPFHHTRTLHTVRSDVRVQCYAPLRQLHSDFGDLNKGALSCH